MPDAGVFGPAVPTAVADDESGATISSNVLPLENSAKISTPPLALATVGRDAGRESKCPPVSKVAKMSVVDDDDDDDDDDDSVAASPAVGVTAVNAPADEKSAKCSTLLPSALKPKSKLPENDASSKLAKLGTAPGLMICAEPYVPLS